MKFFKNVINELKKVKWPDKKYMVKYTIITLVLVTTMSLYFLGLNVVIAFIKELR